MPPQSRNPSAVVWECRRPHNILLCVCVMIVCHDCVRGVVVFPSPTSFMTRTHAQTYTHAHTRIHTRTHAHTHTHTYTHAHTHTHTHTHTCTRTHTMNARTHTYIHVHTHTQHTHTYTRAAHHTRAWSLTAGQPWAGSNALAIIVKYLLSGSNVLQGKC